MILLLFYTIEQVYIGHTSDVEERLQKHNSNHKGYTGKANDWNIVYLEKFSSKELAYARERQVKKWKSKVRLQELIHRKGSEHPD